jgi:hypothetical protein
MVIVVCLQEYVQSHPEEISKVAAVQKQVDEVRNIMVDNIDKVRPLLRATCAKQWQRRSLHHIWGSAVLRAKYTAQG